MPFLHVMLAMAAQVLQPAPVPEPAPATPPAVDEAAATPEDAAAISARKRLNAEVKARTDATDAQYAAAQAAFRFAPGQFNMLYLYGVGEVPV